MTLGQLHDWLDRYFRAWVSNERAEVEALFTPDAVYWTDPFQHPREGIEEIVEAWVGGPQEEVEYAFEPLAMSEDVGVAHWRVRSRSPGAPARDEWDGVLVLRFAPDARCAEHREWLSHRRVPLTAQ